MKRHMICTIATLIAIGLFSSCEELEPVQQETPKITLNKKAAEILEADKAFGFELYREIFNLSSEENLMISPLSVSYALGMTFNGAAGTTQDAFRDVLHFGDLSEEEVNESYKDLMDQLVQLDDKVEFSIANSIWYRLGYEVLSAFIQANRDYFDAEVSEIDFNDPGTVEVINQWIEDKTNGKIQDMLDQIPAEAVMYLINAIYFNATWKYEFEKEKTYTGNFQLAGGNTHQADFMRVSGDFVYTANDDFSAVELPYGDSTFSMVVMLPVPGKGVQDLVDQLDPATWDSWFGQASLAAVQIDMPKFKYDFKAQLNDPLSALGLGVAFTDNADFTRINPEGNLFISRVIHQTFIDVQEEGTEAAAATIVEVSLTSAGGDNPVYFRVDRPFLYVIKENSTGAIVFIGNVGRPEYS